MFVVREGVALGHIVLYVTVGLVWIFLAEYGTTEEEATIRARP